VKSEGLLTLGSVLSALDGRPVLAEVLHQFRPPTRFASKTFDEYRPQHPSQDAAVARLSELATALSAPPPRPLASLFRRRGRARSAGIYLDGGFGVGKTHLLAALWNAVPAPKAYLSFDELMYFIGIAGPAAAAEAMASHRLVCVDEWELDDPGNLKLALAFLRALLPRGTFVAVTSNTIPLELGRGRFSQKDFRAEVEELASAFEVLRVEGDDYRHRRFEARPGAEYFADEAELNALVTSAPRSRSLDLQFGSLIRALGELHPIRFRDFVRKVDLLVVRELDRIEELSEALRWVHFIDAAYDARVGFAASGSVPLAEIFPLEAMEGPYGKKLSRCLSRLEEMLLEGVGGDEDEGREEAARDSVG
jgi:cell division protein ZapE